MSSNHLKYQKIAAFFSRVYSSRLNPLYHLGDFAIFLFAVASVTGIYIFLFYTINPAHAYDSVQQISANPFNGLMRSMHRYSSDLLVVFVILHLIHSLIIGKYKRLLSWISGVISFLVVVFIGVTGYILVWDQKAKLIGFLTAKFISAVPIFDPAIAGAFLLNNLDYVGGFFKVSLFGHIFFSVLTIIILWIHVLRIENPKIFPPRKLMIYGLLALCVVCVLLPVKSDARAESTFIPYDTTFDWYYFFGYYFMKVLPVWANWVLMLGSGLLLAIIPFMGKKKAVVKPQIDLDKCDACNLCSYDCPYGAIDMLVKNNEIKAILNPDNCVGCGICIASCKEHAITLPGYPVLETLPDAPKHTVAAFSCSYFPQVRMPEGVNAAHYKVPCIGSVNPKDLEKMITGHVCEGVLLMGCEECYFRLGKTWTLDRITHKRPPMLSKKVPLSKVRFITSVQPNVNAEIVAFAQELSNNTAANVHHDTAPLTVRDFLKPNHVIAVLLFTVFFGVLALFSATKLHFYPKNEQLLVLSFKYVSSPTVTTQLQTQEKHMQSPVPMVKSRSPIKLQIVGNSGKTLLVKEYSPRGLRKDIAIFVYEELKVAEPSVNIHITETEAAGKGMQLLNVPLSTKDGVIVTITDGQLKALANN
ncbi:hypothetical protein C7N43_20085 [Sphingobacteriales bacterium UPWRP_1]|nr:hypothetical protein BVG80_02475 [Sphingobacteriales bacterium TSM_CSM]PSJ75221.1 hypothetical protein C7N43_20085 [Sphingobacteriales bacterium UPWRP_1]